MREFVLSFHDNDFIGSQAALDHGDIPHFRSRLDKAFLHGTVTLDHEDERSAFLYGNGLRRHCDSIFPYIQQHLHVGELSGKQIRKYCVLTENALQVAKNTFELMELSARSYHRILKVSRTIADMEGEELIHTRHVAEALTYKAFDKKYRS